MNETKKYAVWIRQKLYDRMTLLVLWMIKISGNRHVYNQDAMRLLFKAWDSLTEKQKADLMEGE